MFFDKSNVNLETIIAKSADLTNKPYLHSVIDNKGGFDIDNKELDITLKILCRDIDGKRVERNDLELEIFRSNGDIVIVIAKLNFPDEPILWSGTKVLWMDSNSGKKCKPPNYFFTLENLANRIKSFMVKN